MTPQEFIAKWQRATLSERAACQEHFLDLCAMLGQATPAAADPDGDWYTFERGVTKSEGGHGWADVWKKGHFGWEYKGKHKDLVAAYKQLQLYREDLDNPPLLVVCDLDRFEIHTNFTGTAKKVYAFALAELPEPANLDVLRKLFNKPEALKPQQTTEEITVDAATRFAKIADGLRARGIEPHAAAHYVMKLMFCMFGEDIGLLPDRIFKTTLEGAKNDPPRLAQRMRSLFKAMAKGGDFGPVAIPWFNGGLFDGDDDVAELTRDEIEELIAVNAHDWASVEPSIFGTLFERSLDPAKRSQIGAHYTSETDIRTLIEPVVMTPLRREWADVRAACDKLWAQIKADSKAGKSGGGRTISKPRKQHDKLLRDFVERLADVTVLDPACGSGNFLYVAINSLLDLEKEVIAFAAVRGASLLPQVRPTQLAGLEINPYAQQLAQVVIWIGYLQWMHHNGFNAPRDPILEPIESIRCMDAILDLSDPEHPKEPEWPSADFIVGNPPFLGDKKLRTGLGDDYVESLFKVYDNRIPRQSDLCCYWFERGRELLEQDRTQRIGLLATQAIRGGASRESLQRICNTGRIFFAYSDRDWILDGATVHVSMIGFDNGKETARSLNGKPATTINANLTSIADISQAKPLVSNRNVAYQGVTPAGPFIVDEMVAIKMLGSPSPNQRPSSDVIRPYLNATDIVRRNGRQWIVDFGIDTTDAVASQYHDAFQYVKEHVKPFRESSKSSERDSRWWLHLWTRQALRKGTQTLGLILVTPRVSKYRVFARFTSEILASDATIGFLTNDNFSFGVLQSRAQELWAVKQGTQLREKESGNRYTPKTCFETFPFPEPTDAQREAIAAAAKDLDTLRNNWLNPPEWTREEILEFPGSTDGPWARYVTGANEKGIGTVRYPRTVPKDDECAKRLAKRTLTNLYNERPTWLDLAHKRLDEAVFAAYGWPADLSDDDLLAKLLALNLERAGTEAPSEADLFDEAADDEEQDEESKPKRKARKPKEPTEKPKPTKKATSTRSKRK